MAGGGQSIAHTLVGREKGSDNNRPVFERCFQCSAVLSPGEGRQVGDGRFCEQCFQALLGAEAVVNPPPSERVAERSTGKTEERKASSKRMATSACLACNVPLSPDRELATSPLFGALCPACLQQMNEELQAAQQKKELTPATETASDQSASGAEVWTPGAPTVVCAGCERPMPGPGSYRMLQGAPYCAGCWPFYAQLAAATMSPEQTRAVVTSAPAFTESERATGQAGCDCCGRELGATARMMEGFWLCAACHGQDVALALALKIAKARHQRRLQELALQFERSTDDCK